MNMKYTRLVLAAMLVLSVVGPASAKSRAQADTTLPKVAFASPSEGATVSGAVTVSGSASDNVQVAAIDLKVDSGAYMRATGTTSWSLALDTRAYAEGSHTLMVRATDSSGNQRWASRSITISNSVDITLPSVAFASPSEGATVSGAVTVSGSASDNVQVATVELRVDDTAYRLATGTTSWSVSLDTKAYADGSHTLTVRATDSSGNTLSVSRSITISNSGSGGRIMWGAWIGKQHTGGEPPWDMNALSKFESITGKRLSLVPFAAPFMNCNVSPCRYYEFPKAAMDTIRSHGSIPFFNWSSAASPVTKDQPNFQLRDVTAGTYDTFITRFATAARDWGKPFFLNFDAEMNGRWTPWTVLANGNSGADFVPAWRHVHDIFTRVGASNVTWVWCPNIEFDGSYKPLSDLYPGDAYVDWTCLDGYNWGTNPWKTNVWLTFTQVFAPTYKLITGTIAPSKPMVIAETASTEYGGSKATWISSMLATELPSSFPKMKAFLWFEKWDGNFDWPIGTSASAQNAFVTGIGSSRYAGSEFATLGPGKIAPLP